MVIVFDVDNTLYDFAAFFAPFFRSVTHIVAKETGKDEGEIISEFRDIFGAVGSLEYQFIVQKSSIVQGLEPEKIDKLLTILSVSARQIRSNRLKLYDGVKETLDQIRSSGITCAAITNAPFYQVDQRFRQLGLHRYFDTLICAENVETPEGSAEEKYERRRKEISDRYRKFVELPKEKQKPSDYGYKIIRELYDSVDDFYVVGDSLTKDLAPASNVGYKTIWARYGTFIEPKDLETLIMITPWSDEEIKTSYCKEFKADWVIDKFSEIGEILRIPYQASLF